MLVLSSDNNIKILQFYKYGVKLMGQLINNTFLIFNYILTKIHYI